MMHTAGSVAKHALDRNTHMQDLLAQLTDCLRSACAQLEATHCALWARNPESAREQLIVTWQSTARTPRARRAIGRLVNAAYARSAFTSVELDPRGVSWGRVQIETPIPDGREHALMSQLRLTLTPLVALFVCRHSGTELPYKLVG
jgi:hypothetical protein